MKKRKNNNNIFYLTLVLIFFISISLLSISTTTSLSSDTFEKKEFSEYPVIKHPIIEDIRAEVQVKVDVKRKEREKAEKIRKAEVLLENYQSPFKGLSEIIIRRAEECGGDWRVLMGIAGNESGFGRIPYRLYNPFGYLNNTTYSGWEEALEVLSCRIATRFLKPCNNDLRCIIATYGGPDTDKERWILNIQFFINRLNKI